jgi:hypothetical protein
MHYWISVGLRSVWGNGGVVTASAAWPVRAGWWLRVASASAQGVVVAGCIAVSGRPPELCCGSIHGERRTPVNFDVRSGSSPFCSVKVFVCKIT